MQLHRICLYGLVLTACALSAAVRADALTDAQLLRESGCGGLEPPVDSLRHVEPLDRAAQHWAAGLSVDSAARQAGYAAEQLAGIRVGGNEAATLQILRRTSCLTLMSRGLTEIGTYRRGLESWLVLATPHLARGGSQASFGERVLELVNQVRARGTSCGARMFAPATALRASGTLDRVAYGHAIDMAGHDYFEHDDLAGRTPADRVRAAGYSERLVGENIAYGPASPEEVVRGWLESTGHCENIMDPRFAEMGLAYASGRAPGGRSGQGLYWVQVLAKPSPAT